jgi:hypothetical protein
MAEKELREISDNVKLAYPSAYESEVENSYCDLRLYDSMLVYILVALVALLLSCKGSSVQFIWPTLATLFKFNLFIKATNYPKSFVECVVGGLAGEGFIFHKSSKSGEEERYRWAIGVVYRKYEESTGKSSDSGVLTTTFNFFEQIQPYLYAYLAMCFFFAIICVFKQLSPAVYTKILKEFRWNSNLRYIFTFSLPLYWCSFMYLFVVSQ